jgi:hypothetical protein
MVQGLAVEQSSSRPGFRLVINLKIAKALGTHHPIQPARHRRRVID